MNPIDIIEDGGSFLAVNKPAGLSTQAPGTAESLERSLRKQLEGRSDYIAFPHRLDRPVSGVILVALTKRAARLLSDQFASRKVEKVYRAWVNGKWSNGESRDGNDDSNFARRTRWDDWIRKIPGEPEGEVCLESDNGAKQALTEVQRLHYDADAHRSLMELSPRTGRMHQLRIQAASRGHAIVGDALYGGQRVERQDDKEPPFERILLHAWCITFHDPKNGRKTSIQCPNDDFSSLV